MEQKPSVSSPHHITRRAFLKRTSATTVVTVLALGAFRQEARAQGTGGSGYKIKVTSWSPTDPADADAVKVLTSTMSSTVTGVFYDDVYTMTITATPSPSSFPLVNGVRPGSKLTVTYAIKVTKKSGNDPVKEVASISVWGKVMANLPDAAQPQLTGEDDTSQSGLGGGAREVDLDDDSGTLVITIAAFADEGPSSTISGRITGNVYLEKAGSNDLIFGHTPMGTFTIDFGVY